jgi:hypothetical protein
MLLFGNLCNQRTSSLFLLLCPRMQLSIMFSRQETEAQRWTGLDRVTPLTALSPHFPLFLYEIKGCSPHPSPSHSQPQPLPGLVMYLNVPYRISSFPLGKAKELPGKNSHLTVAPFYPSNTLPWTWSQSVLFFMWFSSSKQSTCFYQMSKACTLYRVHLAAASRKLSFSISCD